MIRPSSLVVGLALAAGCGALVSGAGAAQSFLPQQAGVVDLSTQANVRIDGAAADDRAGASIAGAGDVNGDGIGDVLVGVPGGSTGSAAGKQYVVFGQPRPTTVDLASLGDRGYQMDGRAGDTAFGVAGAGDVNGDGKADVLVAAPGATNNARINAGSAYVAFGKATTTPVDLAALRGAGFRIDGAAGGDRVIALSGLGDVNGDGRSDVLLASQWASNNGRPSSGSAWVVFGKASADPVDLAALGDGGFRIDGAAANDVLGRGSSAGDVNGDGRVDVVLGATGANSAYVVFGKASTATVDLGALGESGFRIDGAPFELTGADVAGVGDMNADGRADIAVGAPFADYNGRMVSGSTYIVFGKATTTPVDLASLDAGGFRIDGAAPGDSAGEASGAGDVNGDGRVDVVVGAGPADNNGRTDSGSAYVVFGKTSSAPVDLAVLGGLGFRIDGAAAGDTIFVSNPLGGTDVNGDGRPDVILGSQFADNNGRSSSGSAYVVYGFGQPHLAYGPLQVTAWQEGVRHAPTQIGRTGPAMFTATPPLPAGLSFDASGAVVGSTGATQAQTTHTVTMQDLVGQVSAPLLVTVAADLAAPKLTLTAASPQRALRQKRIVVKARCNERCTLRAQGTIAIRGSSIRIPLRGTRSSNATTAQRTLSLALAKGARERLLRLLAAGHRARATVTVRARDRAGNTRTATRAITVRR